MSADGDVSAIAPINKGQAAQTTDISTHKDTPSTPNNQTKKSKSNVTKKDKAITTSDLFPKVDNSKKLGKEISRQSAVTDKNVTLTRIDYENGYVCRVENKNGDFVEQAYNADGTPMSQALYNIGVDNNQFKEFIKQDKNGLYIKDKQLFEVLMQNTEKENEKAEKQAPKTEESKPKSEVKSEDKSEDNAPQTDEELDEVLNTGNIETITEALTKGREAIELNSIDDIQDGDIILITHGGLELLKNSDNTTGTHIYRANKKFPNSYLLDSLYAPNAGKLFTDEYIQHLKGYPNASLTIYRAKPKSADTKNKPKKSLRQHKAEEATTATTEDTALLDAITDLMQQQNGMEVFVDEKAQQVLDEVNGKNLTKGLRLAIEDTKNGTDNHSTAISKNADPSTWGETNSISDAKVDNRIEVSNENTENLNKLAQTIQKNSALKPEDFLLVFESELDCIHPIYPIFH